MMIEFSDKLDRDIHLSWLLKTKNYQIFVTIFITNGIESVLKLFYLHKLSIVFIKRKNGFWRTEFLTHQCILRRITPFKIDFKRTFKVLHVYCVLLRY